MKSGNLKFLGAFLLVVFAFGFASAEFSTSSHTPSVTLSPEIASCGDVANEFTVNIANTAGYGIYNVKIYEADTNIVDLTCGAAPTGFVFLGFQYDSYCEYETDPYGTDPIENGENVNFTFDAILSQDDCISTFLITTLDNEGIIGSGDGEEVETALDLVVDCEKPVILKTIGDPKIIGDITNFLWWITDDSLFEILVTDNDTCDLGLDSCLIVYTLDGVTTTVEVNDTGLAGDPSWSYEFTYDEDSSHFLEITCYDLAGNMGYHSQTEKVDITEPETELILTEPKKESGGQTWIDTDTVVTLDPIDPEYDPSFQGDCSIGVDKTWYRNDWYTDEHLGSTGCYDPSFCTPANYEQFFGITQFYGEFGDCINEYQDVCSETYDHNTPEWIACVDDYAHNTCDINDAWTLYDGGVIDQGQESCHVFSFFSVDFLGNIESINTECIFVDKTEPEVLKDNGNAIPDSGEPSFMGENNPDGSFHWIKTDMPVTFRCDDSWSGQAPHPSGDEQLCFKVSYDYPAWGYDTEKYCDTALENEYCCVDATMENEFVFYFEDESMHNLEYYCVDAVGKESEEHVQYYKVDDTAPSLIEKIITGPSIALEGTCPPAPNSNDICHIDGVTTIDVNVEDGGAICAVGVEECRWKYRVFLDPTGAPDWSPYTEWNYDFPINFPEESKHELVIECYDFLGNTMTDTEIFYVDKTAPETTFSVTGPQIPDPILEDSDYPRYVDTDSRIVLEATDSIGPHDSGVDRTMYRVTTLDSDVACESAGRCAEINVGGDFAEYAGPFGLAESCHLIEYYSVDNVNKIEDTERQCVFSDHTAPVVEIVDVVGPEIPCEPGEGCDYWVADHRTDIYLQCFNAPDEPHPAPLDKIYWRINIDGVLGDWGNQPVGELPIVITFLEDSVHELEYYCTDKVNKTSDVGSTTYRVDSVGPEITIDESDPKYYNATEDKLYLNHVTTVTVSTVDPDPTGFGCNVEGVTCTWGYYLDGGIQFYGPFDYVGPITFPEDTRHNLVVTCQDALGNENETTKTYYVDWTAPGIDKNYGEPFLTRQFQDYWAKWISSETPIFSNVTDDGPHKSGIKEVQYRTMIVDNEECKYYYNVCDGECIATTGGNGNGGDDEYSCDEASDNDSVAWIPVDPVNYSGFDFKIPEDSCHLIEIMATDNVDKCNLHKQWVYVDNQPPTPNKTVFEVSTEWYPVDVATDPFNPDATHFYPWIVDRCWNGENDSIDCWKVTMDTPISMECIDPEPHPVDTEKVCFNVEMDGEDITDGYGCEKPGKHGKRCGRPDGYCEYYGGDMVGEYCCVDHTIDDFEFLEESEHNLKYYCEDALGNGGPESSNWIIDDEKFKVSGKMFKIRLNDKWNLVSVPFVLQKDDPEVVFKDAESVKTVWSYNAEDDKWSVYRPDDGNISDLDSIEPGLGYWILSDCDTPIEWTPEDRRWRCDEHKCEMLVVGGSLYSPGPVTPPSQDLPEGWSLIGLYGDENNRNRHGYYGPNQDYGWNSHHGWFDDGKDAYCELSSLRNQEDSIKWNALIGYWEPENPEAWYDLNQCDEMDLGAGYWIFMNEEGTYAPSTIICDDEICEDGWGWW